MDPTDPAPSEPPLQRPPRTRCECIGGPRPCPWGEGSSFVCRFHLGEGRPESCALDVADRGDLEQHQVAVLLGVSRNRVWQVELAALAKLKRTARAVELARDADLPEPRKRRAAAAGRRP